MKIDVFYWNLTKISSWRSNWQEVSISPGNGLVLNERQAIIWSNYRIQYYNDMVKYRIIYLRNNEMFISISSSEPRLNMKTVFPRYGDSHVED